MAAEFPVFVDAGFQVFDHRKRFGKIRLEPADLICQFRFSVHSVFRHKSNKCKRFKTKAGFGEGTPQQVRPVIETQFQLLKLWPQVDTCLSLFGTFFVLKFQNMFGLSKAGECLRIEVSLVCVRRLHRICVPAPVLQRRCPARPHFVRGRGAISRSRRLMQFSRYGYKELQAGDPAANSLGK